MAAVCTHTLSQKTSQGKKASKFKWALFGDHSFQTPETSVPRTLHYLLEPQIRNTLANHKHFIRWVLSPCSGSSHCKLLFILPYFSLLLTHPSGLIHWFSTASVSKPVLITATFSPPQTEGSSGFEDVWWFYLLQRLTFSSSGVCNYTSFASFVFQLYMVI